MTSNRKRLTTLALCTVACLLWTASFATGAEASPAWFFNGAPLEGSETTLNHAGESSLAIPGLATTCEPFVFQATISNTAGTGKASITKVPLSNCFTSVEQCTVGTIKAEKLPWSSHLATIGGNDYLIVEGVRIDVVYEGAECVLGETLVTFTGSAGGLIDNATESVTFSASSFLVTKTAMKALGSAVEWTGTFTMIATGLHVGQSLEVF
jgi:hypothetical protein